MNNKKIWQSYPLSSWKLRLIFFGETISKDFILELINSIDHLLVFPERHLDKIRWIDEIFDDFTASNNSFSRFILLIDLSINRLRFITHASSNWFCWMSKTKKEEKKRKEIVEQSNSPSCQSRKEKERKRNKNK
jgi:hypothetical protein